MILAAVLGPLKEFLLLQEGSRAGTFALIPLESLMANQPSSVGDFSTHARVQWIRLVLYRPVKTAL